MREALAWFGLDWDAESLQSDSHAAHAAALDRLAEAGLLYACDCSRSQIRRAGLRAADGGFRYPGRCRSDASTVRDWRDVPGAVRLRLDPGVVEVPDESGSTISIDPAAELGDPVLRSRNGAIAYHLACVVDDGRSQISRIVRGRDLATHTSIHVVLQRHLDLPTPRYRHHFLLLERSGVKFAKLHGAVGWREISRRYSAAEFCGWLAGLAGLTADRTPLRPRDLIDRFDWGSVRDDDVPLRWTGRSLEPIA